MRSPGAFLATCVINRRNEATALCRTAFLTCPVPLPSSPHFFLFPNPSVARKTWTPLAPSCLLLSSSPCFGVPSAWKVTCFLKAIYAVSFLSMSRVVSLGKPRQRPLCSESPVPRCCWLFWVHILLLWPLAWLLCRAKPTSHLTCHFPHRCDRNTWQKRHKEGRVCFGSQSEDAAQLMGKSWWQEVEAASHVASVVRKQMELILEFARKISSTTLAEFKQAFIKNFKYWPGWNLVRTTTWKLSRWVA